MRWAAPELQGGAGAEGQTSNWPASMSSVTR